MPPPRCSGEAVKHLQSIDIALKERIKGINRSLRIWADRAVGMVEPVTIPRDMMPSRLLAFIFRLSDSSQMLLSNSFAF